MSRKAPFLSSLLVALTLWALPAVAQRDRGGLIEEHEGITLIALPLPAGAPAGVRLPRQILGLERLAAAYDALVGQSPLSRRAIERLKSDGIVLLIYEPWGLPRTVHGDEAVALFMPHFPDAYGLASGKRRYIVVVGPIGIQWPHEELAAVLAHELAGHGIQHLEARIDKMRELDVECEAYLIKEQANQDLRLDKDSRLLMSERLAMERHYCADFRAFMARHGPDDLGLWSARNPDTSRLLSIFERYLVDRTTVEATRKALAADDRLHKEELGIVYRSGGKDELYSIGLSFWDGIGRRTDRAEAVRWFARASALGHVQAREWLVAAAETGLPAHQNNLGLMYEEEGAFREAFAWYTRAAESDDANAQTNLGRLYFRGVGVARDYAMAARWFGRAAEQGGAAAQYYLGLTAEKGLGRERDLQKAAAWYRRAAEDGDALANYRLGRLHYQGGLGAQDLPQAVARFRLAAEAGHAAAQNMLGWLHLKGRGVEKDYARARAWLEASARQDHPNALYNLGTIHRDGLGVVKDHKYALTWFRRAAELDFAPAMHRLGWMTSKGQGLPADAAAAADWFRAAAALGHGASLLRLGKIHAEGIGVEKDLVQAYVWYRIAEVRQVKKAGGPRAWLEGLLTAAQKESAERQVKAWKPKG